MPLEPADAMDRMNAEGYPDWLINAVTASLIDLKYGIPQLEAEAKVNSSAAFQARSKEAHDAAEIEYNILVNWTPERLQLKYGDLDPPKVAVVAGTEIRYRENTDHALAEALAPVLTEEELGRYLRYNSLLARTIQRITSTIDIDEATYNRLWQHVVEREGTAAPDVSGEKLFQQILEPDSVAYFHEVLGDEQFLKTIRNIQPELLRGDEAFRSINLESEVRADLIVETYRILHEAQTLRNEAMFAKFREAYDTIVAIANFTPQQKAAFDQSRFGSGLARGQSSWTSESVPTR